MIEAKILTNATDQEYATIDCPGCKALKVMDREQYEGKVSIQCACGFHKTIDFRRR